MKRAKASLAVALVLVTCSREAVGAPTRLRYPAAANPIAIKCKGRVRQGCRAASRVAAGAVPVFASEPEPAPSETLAQAIQAAYRTAPALQAQRYQLRAADEDYAQAVAELHPTTTLEVSGGYTKTVPGRTTQAQRPGATSKIITSNTMAARVTLAQPLSTGGRAEADRAAGLAGVSEGRAQLRGTEGDLLLQVITAYANIRRDAAVLRTRSANLRQMQATLDEVIARREAGELTRTDIALAETQLHAALSQYESANQQYEQDRAGYARLVGRDPGVLADVPALPHLPGSIDAAFALAETSNPDLAQAIAAERVSRARIAAAAAQGKPTLTLNGTATLTGQAVPFYLHNEDQEFAGRAVLTVPITTGGRVRSLVAQAEDRNAADRIGIEGARRQMVESIVNAWNALATAERQINDSEMQLASARVYDEGTFEEYRAGLRSTFDVLYAHSALRDAEIALVSAKRDQLVASAALLRHVGLLEARDLLTGTALYDPDANFRKAAARAPLDPLIRRLDRIDMNPLAPEARQHGLLQPPRAVVEPKLAPAGDEPPSIDTTSSSPMVPLPGTTGTPSPDRSLKRP